MSGVRAIETRYAGCLFRSRLEARWAVFFDTLGIPWEYEAQGYQCSARCFLSLPPGADALSWQFWYLPDFWLPSLNLHAEVKGHLTEPETLRLLDAAAYLSTAGAGGCYDDAAACDLVVFGDVPRPNDLDLVPVKLHMHKGDLLANAWRGEDGRSCYDEYNVIADDGGSTGWICERRAVCPDSCMTPEMPGHYGDPPHYAWPLSPRGLARAARLLTTGMPAATGSANGYANIWHSGNSLYGCQDFQRGYAAARSARFEHGQSGAQ